MVKQALQAFADICDRLGLVCDILSNSERRGKKWQKASMWSMGRALFRGAQSWGKPAVFLVG